MKLSIIIPAYNEQDTIHDILDSVSAVDLIGGVTSEMVVVNDCSSDNTADLVREYQTKHPELEISFYEHKFNMGK